MVRILPRACFLVAGDTWHACRTGEADPERFVVDPDLEIPQTRGWLQLRHNLIQDLAALNRSEMLLWDTWGVLDSDTMSDSEEMLLDRVAGLTCGSTPLLGEVRALYAYEPSLRVPDMVTSFNVMTGEPRQVAVVR